MYKIKEEILTSEKVTAVTFRASDGHFKHLADIRLANQNDLKRLYDTGNFHLVETTVKPPLKSEGKKD